MYDEKKATEEAYEANLTKEIIPSYWIDLDKIDTFSDTNTAIKDFFEQQQAQFVCGELDIDNHTNRSSVAADAVLQCECIVKPAADDFRMLCLVCDDSLGSVYAEAFRIAQPDSVFVCVQNRHGVEIASFLCIRKSSAAGLTMHSHWRTASAATEDRLV